MTSSDNSLSSALRMPDRRVPPQRNHAQVNTAFLSIPPAADISRLGGRQDIHDFDDELGGEDEDVGRGGELENNHHQHQLEHLHQHAIVSTHRPRARGRTRVAVHDAPPRIELSNSVWSSLDIGANSTSTSARNSGVMAQENETEVDELEEEDDGEGPDEDDSDVGGDDHNDGVYPPFRDRLDSALEALRSPSSPLVPGLVPRDTTNVPTATAITNHETSTTIDATEALTVPRPVLGSTLPTTASTSSTSNSSSHNIVTPPRDHQQQFASQGVSNSNSLSSNIGPGSTSTTNASMVGRIGPPPTLPPILTDTTDLGSSSGTGDDDVMWRRGSQRQTQQIPPVSQASRIREQEQGQGRTRGGSTELFTAQNGGARAQRSVLGEVQLPSPLLSGFYDWLEGASVNADAARNSVQVDAESSAIPTASGSGSNGSENSSVDARPQADAQVQNHDDERRSWEEDVLSGWCSFSFPRFPGFLTQCVICSRLPRVYEH